MTTTDIKPVFSVSYGDIKNKITGRSRRGVITYYLWEQNITINGVVHEVKAPDESWLKSNVEALIKEQRKLFYKQYPVNKMLEVSIYGVIIFFMYLWISLFIWIIN